MLFTHSSRAPLSVAGISARCSSKPVALRSPLLFFARRRRTHAKSYAVVRERLNAVERTLTREISFIKSPNAALTSARAPAAAFFGHSRHTDSALACKQRSLSSAPVVPVLAVLAVLAAAFQYETQRVHTFCRTKPRISPFDERSRLVGYRIKLSKYEPRLRHLCAC